MEKNSMDEIQKSREGITGDEKVTRNNVEESLPDADLQLPDWKPALRVICRLLRIPEDKERFLLSGEEELPLWFLAAYEGMPLEEMQKLKREGLSEKEVLSRILQHMQQRFPASEDMNRKFLELQAKTQEALSDYAYIRDVYIKELSESREQERKAQQYALEAKEETIRMQKEKITDLEGRIRTLKKGKKQPLIAEPEEEKRKISLLDRLRKTGRGEEIARFREVYLDDSEYGEEQKEFLLSCLEEGLSFEELKRFASPALTVEQMGRLRRVYEVRYRK